MNVNEDAAVKALEWCRNHIGWERICDIEDADSLYKTWDELSERKKNPWIRKFGLLGAKEAWGEFGDQPCKVQYGFISGEGKFYKDILDVPLSHGLMQIFKVK